MRVEEYRAPATLTALTPQQVAMVEAISHEPIQLCRAAQSVVMLPELAIGAGVEPARADEKNIRPTSELLRIALSLSDDRLGARRAIDQRVLGTCRHFALVSCALLRARSIPARARCGFATYFQPGLHVDHWITEYWDGNRWVRVDSEVLGLGFVEHPDDLQPGEFLAGGEAWLAYRNGADPQSFGVHGTENWGAPEIVGNAIRDLAALHKVEMLPWDEWGPMRSCYDDGLTPEIEALMDDLSAATITEDHARLEQLYAHLTVPEALIDERESAS